MVTNDHPPPPSTSKKRPENPEHWALFQSVHLLPCKNSHIFFMLYLSFFIFISKIVNDDFFYRVSNTRLSLSKVLQNWNIKYV